MNWGELWRAFKKGAWKILYEFDDAVQTLFVFVEHNSMQLSRLLLVIAILGLVFLVVDVLMDYFTCAYTSNSINNFMLMRILKNFFWNYYLPFYLSSNSFISVISAMIVVSFVLYGMYGDY